MIGETVSHYRILEELGGGAMGVVYKAQDTRLKRLVALKFLSPMLTRDPAAKHRFVQEAESASALDDPHVCTVHDIDEAADGRVFIAMSFYDGQSLKRRIQRGPMPIDEVATIGAQIARGLAAAHEAGIVHRDIKPANVMITSKGEVKIVDFGIAKLSGQADLTSTGLSLGTVSYMAPEQFSGQVDRRADLWALGVVLYEMLASRRPFEGEIDMAVMKAVLDCTPLAIKVLRPDVPDTMAAIIDRALQKDPTQRPDSANDIADALDECVRPAVVSATPVDDTGAILRTLKRPAVSLPALVIVGVLGYGLVSTLLAQSRARWARERAIPEINRLLQVDDYEKAYQLAQQADRYIPNDPVLTGLLPQMTGAAMFSSVKPDGARVYAKPYADPKAEWQLLGTAPFKNVLLPRGTYRWRIQADGFESAEFARNVGDPGGPSEAVQLVARDGVPAGMVAVSASQGPVDITGFATEDSVALARFAIDRHEVTNREFKTFVQAGGYAKRQYWTHDIVRDGARLSWDEAMALFRDSSGRPGPATWELGDFPAGQADYPVGGVSWYEAAAYAAFRGASLPTIYHWARAALAFTRAAPIRGLIVEASNFAGKGPVAVESTGAVGPYGTYDMAGNVREWCTNLSGENRWILGGAWNDHSYMYIVPYSLPPLDRSLMNGFRLAKYADNERVAELSKPIEVFRHDFRTAKPVSDEVFQVFKRQFSYVPSPPNARVEQTDRSSPDWVREKVTLDTGYGERLTTYIFIPKRGTSSLRHQTVVFFPGLGQFLSNVQSERISANDFGMDFMVKSGRVLVMPVWKGSYERFDGFVTLQGDRYLQTFRQRMFQWRQEMGQLIDYLATRPDVDSGKLGYTGVSFGSSVALPLLALEPRLKVAVLLLAGFTYRDLLPEMEAVNYAPRITMPVLMLEARYDHLFPVELSQQPLMSLLGAPADQKRQVLFDAGHGPLPRGQVIHESLAWLDRYLGPQE